MRRKGSPTGTNAAERGKMKTEGGPLWQHACDWRLLSGGVMVTPYCAQPLSHVPLFVTPWTVAHQAPLSLGILQRRILEWVAMPSSRGIFPTQELNRGLLHCRWILYQLSYQGSPVMVTDPLKLERIEESVR